MLWQSWRLSFNTSRVWVDPCSRRGSVSYGGIAYTVWARGCLILSMLTPNHLGTIVFVRTLTMVLGHTEIHFFPQIFLRQIIGSILKIYPEKTMPDGSSEEDVPVRIRLHRNHRDRRTLVKLAQEKIIVIHNFGETLFQRSPPQKPGQEARFPRIVVLVL